MRRTCIGLLAGVAALGGCAHPSPSGRQAVDLLIRGGTVYDGRSESARVTDVGVSGDRILFIGPARDVRAGRVIDARGLVVAPGFIDPHTHLDEDLASPDPAVRFLPSQLLQGVTTVVVGNDGEGSPEVASRMSAIAAAGSGANVPSFVGFGAVRKRVIGEDARAPTATELAGMRTLVASAMCEGALGLSTGLYYAPQSYAETEEVTELAREAAARGGLYDTHLRDEGSGFVGLAPAIDEAVTIGRSAGLPVHIAHIKALGVDAHGQSAAAVGQIERTRASGLRVTADQYPWEASGTTLVAAFIPGWAQDGGADALNQRLRDPQAHARLLPEVEENIRKRGGAAAALVTGGAHRGERLDAIARRWSIDSSEAVLRLIAEQGDARIASFNMSAADIARFRAQPWVVTSSDAVAGHPRKYGSFARAWQMFVRGRGLLAPGAFIRRSSGLTAELLGLEGRGVLAAGAFADIVAFDPATFAANADYDHPERTASGVVSVVVNGAIVVDNGRPTGVLAGRPLLKSRLPDWSCPS